MKFLFYLGHPAHYHLFKNVINTLEKKGHKIFILIKKKDVLENILKEDNVTYFNILSEGRTDSKIGMTWGMLKRDWRIFKFCYSQRPDMLIGTPPEIGHIGTVLRIPSINVREDDAKIYSLVFRNLTYPWADCILSPSACQNGKWDKKTIKYQGYHELAYLHPNYFKPLKKVVQSYFSIDKPFILIRFAKLTAHHDKGIQGISNTFARKIIDLISLRFQVYITSERELPSELEKYRMSINHLDIHHILAFAHMFIGDSQTMAAEAGVLGTPFIRYNDFVGNIGYLNELEKIYKLGFGFKTNQTKEMLNKVKKLLDMYDRKVFQKRRQRMMSEKIDVTSFMIWFIENYPKSVKIMKKNPDYQYKFK